MTSIAQIQRAMGPVYRSWATMAKDYHHTSVPDDTPPSLQTTTETFERKVRERLARGFATKEDLMREIGSPTKSQWSTVSRLMCNELRFESSGFTKTQRRWIYWLDCVPPPMSERSFKHQILVCLKNHPWASTKEVVSVTGLTINMPNVLSMMSSRGWLEFRGPAGKREYRAIE